MYSWGISVGQKIGARSQVYGIRFVCTTIPGSS